MKEFGMFTANRAIAMENFVGFGASETFITGLKKGLLDVCVNTTELPVLPGDMQPGPLV